MHSIGFLSKATQVKIPTIRYYESICILNTPQRSQGNQRRYSAHDLDQLKFIKHARQLGLDIESIRQLISLKMNDSITCEKADQIAQAHLHSVRKRIAALQKLEQELMRISACESTAGMRQCNILASIADHGSCDHDHDLI
ncbi:MAG: DNA-binding transcriptional MerR regulator [Cryomorphaceae bacterium]|jgi:DNA-binding transcriptional MerR regulator